MKNILFTILFCLLTSIGFVGCNVENNTNLYMPPTYGWYWQPNQMYSNGQYGIGGYVVGTGAPITRAYMIQQSDVIDNYDSFSLFMWTKDSVLGNGMFNGILNPQQGTWGYEGRQRFFDNNQPRYSFLGILPKGDYTIKADSTVNVSLEDFITEGVEINAQKYNKEFIVAKTTVEKQNYAQGATLNFEHQNSIVRIKFETNTGNNLEILDFTPYTPGTPEVPATPGTVTTETRQSKVIDELVVGNTIGWPYGIDANLTSSQPNNFFGSSNATYGSYLQAIANVVNAQFKYYDADGNVINTDWQYSPDITTNVKRNVYFIKLASTASASDFASGNDAFWQNADDNLKNIFQKAYNEGWRVVRINNTNSEKGWSAWLVNNTQMSLTVTTITGGTEYQPAVEPTGKAGIVVLPATSQQQNGKDAVLATFPEKVTANVGLNGITYTVNTTEQEIIFTKAGVVNYSVYSPTNWYTFPVVHANNFGFTIKFSYTLNGETRYDARVFVPASKCNWQPGKWYDYVIKVNSSKSGKTTPEEADEDDPKIEEEFPINVNSSVDEYTEGEVHEFTL